MKKEIYSFSTRENSIQLEENCLCREWIIYCRSKYQESLQRGLSTPLLERVVFPIVGEYRLKELRPLYFSEIKSHLVANYSITTCRDSMNALAEIFNYACLEGRIPKNPISKDLTVFSDKNHSVVKEKIVFTDEQIEKINIMIPFLEYKDLISLGAVTGIYLQYSRALRWTDLDFDTGKLSVYKKLPNESSTRSETPLPPEKIRIMRLPPFITDYLIERYDKFLLTRKFNSSFNPDNYIFTNKKGDPIEAYKVRDEVFRLGTVIGIENLTYNDLVNNSFTYAVKCGININQIMDYYNFTNKTGYLEAIFMNRQYRRACND